MLVSQVDLSADADLQLPSALLDLVQETLILSYPPEPSNKVVSLWLLRSLVTVIDACPLDMVAQLLESLLEGLVIWLTDSVEIFSLDEYSREVSYSKVVVNVYANSCLIDYPFVSDNSLAPPITQRLVSSLQSFRFAPSSSS